MNNKYLKRLNITTIILIVMMAALIVATFKLMIVEGSKYREISDNKRIKDIHITAPRGNIYDRNGVLLAGTRPSFSVQLLADETKMLSMEERNRQFLTLIRLLEEDGTTYIEDMPIRMNTFSYKDVDDYLKEDLPPDEKAIEIIIENKLIPELILQAKKSGSDEGFDFIIANRALNALQSKGINIPMRVKYDGSVSAEFKGTEVVDEFLKRNDLSGNENPIDVLVDKINEDKNIIRKILNHPIARQMAYELIKSKGLSENLVLNEFDLSDDREYLLNKVELNKKFPVINLESDPKEDFVNIVDKSSMNLLLEKVEITDKNEVIEPAKILINMIEKKTGKSTGLVAKADLAEEIATISYADENQKTSEKPIDMLIRLGRESGVLPKFITDEKIKYIAQESNTQAGIIPQISVIEWDYIFVKNKNDLFEKYGLKKDSDTKSLLDKMRDFYDIDTEDDYEALALISIHRKLESQGHLGYQPINIAYGIKEKTISKIEENIKNNSGINISIEPVRYYPEGKSAAHVLGYLGRISQPDEIQKYVEEKGYGPNELIGKTGVEESFENVLRGMDGKRVVEVDSLGNRTQTLDEKSPIPGSSVYLTNDIELQKVAEDALRQTLEKLREGGEFESKWGNAPLRGNEQEGRPYYNASSGAVVVLDIETGEVLALANEKSYDPNLFATGISNSDWKSLFPDDEKNPLADRPLLNIAMQSQIQPGSTFKLLSSLAALEKGLSPEREIEDSGYVEIGDTIFGCWLWNTARETHGYENLYSAIRDSCNFYYYALALGENPQTGDIIGLQLDIDDIRKTAIKLGLDTPTGIEINIPYESGGRLPNPDEKKQTMKSLLSIFLEENLEKYIKKDKDINPVIMTDMIKTICSWVEEEATITREDIEQRLEDLGIDAEKEIDEDLGNITDIIKYNYIDQSGWNITDMLNVVIGQGQNAYTPLQMANYVSIFANGGYKNKISVIKEVKSYDDTKVLLKNEPVRQRIELNNYENLKYIGTGMNMASHFGSLQRVFGNFPVEVALKTGTAERDGLNPETGEKFDDYSWMVAFAPYDKPKIAIATLLYQAGSGSNCASIVREVVGEYLKMEPNPEEVNTDLEIPSDEVIE
ncbi:MAG: penicillin-binding transpeptidase domain-containing protein [Tissierellia bacterium]|nr:penicillin-binding transpeptidase domain-containing protein [Tissierellia bacterium]